MSKDISTQLKEMTLFVEFTDDEIQALLGLVDPLTVKA
jgi:hypothetical protein